MFHFVNHIIAKMPAEINYLAIKDLLWEFLSGKETPRA